MMMTVNRKLYSVPGRRNVELIEEAVPAPDAGGALVRQRLTLLYPGYDLSWVEKSERDSERHPLGMLAIGVVEKAAAEGPREGEMVLWNGPHADYAVLDPSRHLWRGVAEADHRLLLAAIGAEASMGLTSALEGAGAVERAIVIGQGMLGHLAGQWLKRRGSEVAVVENSPKRLEFSKYQGLTRRIDTHNLDWKARLAALNPGGADLVVDAAARAGTLADTLDAAKPGATLALLGPWRPDVPADALPGAIAQKVAAMNLRVVGPGPWLGAAADQDADRRKRELEELDRWIAWIGSGEIPVERLITNQTPASGAAMDTKRLATGVKSMCGVVIHWDE